MIRIKTYLIAFLALILLGACAPKELNAQWLQPQRIKFGASLGFGGLHAYGKPSFDVHWWRTTLRVSPGLWYMSAGVTQKLAYFSPKKRHDRIIIFSLYYLNDWFLANKPGAEIKKDVQAFMFMPGIHVNLNHLGTYYLQISGGYMYAHETNFPADKSFVVRRHHHWPMGEIRFGGVFLSRKEHHQKFKYYPRDVEKIKKRKLKFRN